MKNEESLEELLPHAAPMILLTGCEKESVETEANAWVDVSPSSPFFDASIGGVPGCVALEYMAQAMALVVGFMRRRRGAPPKVGFVLGSRRMSVKTPVFRDGERYLFKCRDNATAWYYDNTRDFQKFDLSEHSEILKALL